MRAVVLVGGFGTRLRPLTATTPKQMLPVIDRPMIEHVLDHVAAYGIDDAVLSLGYRPDAFSNRYPDGVCAGVDLHYAIESEPLDTAGAIRFAALDAGIDGRFVVLNGDVLTDLDLGRLIGFHESHGGDGTIALHRVEDPSAFGVVPTDADGRVEAFVEKPSRHQAPTDLINAGTYVFEPSVLDRIAPGRKVSVEREVFPGMVADGALYATDGDSYWIDTGTPATYLQAQLDFLDGRRGPPPAGIRPGAVVSGRAHVTRSLVCEGAVVEPGARVSESVLLPGASVGSGATISGSIVGWSAKIGEGAMVTGASVLGEGEVVAPGDVLDRVTRPAAERRAPSRSDRRSNAV